MKRRVRIAGIGVSLPGFRLLRRGSLARAVEAGRRCLADAKRRPVEVGVLIHAGVTRDGHVCEPANAAYIQRRLGINVEFQGARTLSFDLVNGGCGMLDAAHVLCVLLQAGTLRAGLVTASEGNVDWRAKGDRPCPDSGAAILLELSPRPATGFGSFAFRTRRSARGHGHHGGQPGRSARAAAGAARSRAGGALAGDGRCGRRRSA